MAKCRFRKKNGGKCGADVQSGKKLCVFHDPARAADGRRARRIGGINRSRTAPVLPPETPYSPLRTPNEVSALLGESINRILRGQLDPRNANCVAYMSSVLLRSLEQGPVEERLARLEAALGLASNEPAHCLKEGSQDANPVTVEADRQG